MKLTSPVFENGQSIPAIYSRDGDNISPPLHWTDAPSSTKSFALIVDDPDAPSGVFTHWVIFNLPGQMQALDREVPEGGHYGSEAIQGRNDYGGIGYGGPQPPSGEHRYFFKLYALDKKLELAEGCSKEDVLNAMSGHVLDQAELMGLYAFQKGPEMERELREGRAHEDAYDLAARKNQFQDESDEYDQSDEAIQKAG